jgi:hypothetical protein
VLLEPSLDLTLSKSKLEIAVCTSNCMYCKNIYRNCMYHGNPEMHVMAAIAISSNCISIGIVIELIAISLDHASIDVDSGFDVGFDVGFNGWFDGRFDGGFNCGFNGQFHLAVLGYRPQQSVQQLRREVFMAISQEGLTGSLLNKLVILQTL